MRKRGDGTLADPQAERVWFDATTMHVVLRDGRELAVPISSSPRLASATADERDDWRLIADGVGIQWPRIDEDLSVEGLIGMGQAPQPA